MAESLTDLLEQMAAGVEALSTVIKGPWREEDHPRGQPDNPGQFGPGGGHGGGGGAAVATKPKPAAAKPAGPKPGAGSAGPAKPAAAAPAKPPAAKPPSGERPTGPTQEVHHPGQDQGAGNSPESGPAEPVKVPNAIIEEPSTAPPPGGYDPDVTRDDNGDGVADAARVGVPAYAIPPPPAVPRLNNLTERERQVEDAFIKAYEAAPDKVAKDFLGFCIDHAKEKGDPPTFGTDDAKLLTDAWNDTDLNERSKKRATLNTPLHQTANAIAKRAFLMHLDTLKAGDQILVTNGGCGCHVADTPLMQSDGSLKMVQDFDVGDELMGPDSRPRKIQRLIRGRGKLYRVTPKKGKSFVVNEDHVLALKYKNRHIEITVKDFIKQAPAVQQNSCLYRTGIEFPMKPVALDPYFLGIWLGDGCHSLPQITTEDAEIVLFLQEFIQGIPDVELVSFQKSEGNNSRDYRVALMDKHVGKGHPNPVTMILKSLGVFKNKHIPQSYIKNDRQTRLRLLAGLLDTDGSLQNGFFEFSTKCERMAYDVAYLSRSLGLAAYVKPKHVKNEFIPDGRTYWRVSIQGDIDMIPTKIKRKRANKRMIPKNALHVGFRLDPVGEGEFFGFTLEGDGLYLMEDFTVTHNSGKGYALKKIPKALEFKRNARAVWDSAGDQAATENPWIQTEAEKRGLKVNYVYVHADPKTQWADPERGVIKRAGDPEDGRMVGAMVFADSYANGARNMKAFADQHANNPNASFTYLQNAGPKPIELPGIPEEALSLDAHELANFAIDAVQKSNAPEHVKRGALMDERIWRKPPPQVQEKNVSEKDELFRALAKGVRRLSKVIKESFFDESQHPRGQPDNPGQFAPKPGGGKKPEGSKPKPKPAGEAKPASAAPDGAKPAPKKPKPASGAKPASEGGGAPDATAAPANTGSTPRPYHPPSRFTGKIIDSAG